MSAVLELFEEVVRRLDAGESMALATVIATRGSTPREVGAKMLVRLDGSIAGTIGGGCGEAEVYRAALDVIDTKVPTTVEVDLTQEMSLRSEAVCGGTMRVFVEPRYVDEGRVDPGVALIGDGFARAIQEALRNREAVALATVVRGGAKVPAGSHLLITERGIQGSLGAVEVEAEVAAAARLALVKAGARPFSVRIDNQDSEATEIFVELFVPTARLLILGAGHIAQPVAQIAKILGFHVTVWDDRAAFAQRGRFPTADEVRVADFGRELSAYVKDHVDALTYVVLVTRGHQQDVPALRSLLKSAAPYIGMIGSKRRVWTVLKLLSEEGFPGKDLLRIYAPVGLDIGAITPGEIAVAICAELVRVLRGGTGRSLSEQVRELFAQRLRCQTVRIGEVGEERREWSEMGAPLGID